MLPERQQVSQIDRDVISYVVCAQSLKNHSKTNMYLERRFDFIDARVTSMIWNGITSIGFHIYNMRQAGVFDIFHL